MKNIFLLKQREKYLELPLQRLLTGLKQVKSSLSFLHPDQDYMIHKIYATLLVSLMILYRKGKYATVEFHHRNKLTILSDNKIFSNRNILITRWLQISVQELIGREKVLNPFWNNLCQELSTKLWLPTEIAYVDSDSNLSSSYSTHVKLNSSFAMITNQNPKIPILQMTSYPSYTSIHAETWADEDIPMRCRKIKMYPNKAQKQIFKRWMGTARYVYNKALSGIKKHNESKSFQDLRNRYVTNETSERYEIKLNDFFNKRYIYDDPVYINDWELETPKDIRAGAVDDLSKAYKTCFSQLKTKLISDFGIKYRSKKKGDTSIEIPKSAISIDSKGKIFIYKSYTKKSIKLSRDFRKKNIKITNDCKMQYNNGWFLIIPIKGKIINNEPELGKCALDPGSRKFQVLYSKYETVKFVRDKDLLNKLKDKQKFMQSLRTKKIRTRCSNRALKRMYNKQRNLLYDNIINYLCMNYDNIFLPTFKTQELMKKLKNRNVKYELSHLAHYRFKERLRNKCELMRNTTFHDCTEEYTTQTCTNCGILNNVGLSETYNCGSCLLNIDRDYNGARNIYMKVECC